MDVPCADLEHGRKGKLDPSPTTTTTIPPANRYIPWIIPPLEKIVGPVQNHAQHFRNSQIKATFRMSLDSLIHISLGSV